MIASESEAINSATYVDNYLDSVENLPDDVQRQLSRIRDIDVQYRGNIKTFILPPKFPLIPCILFTPNRTNTRCGSLL